MAKFKKIEEEKILDVNASMQGNLVFKDSVNLRINGNFQGSLECRGLLTIGKQAVVESDIKGENIIIEGKFKGKIEASKKVSLKNGCVAEGEILCPILEVEEGAFFEGKVKMLKDLLDLDELSQYLKIEKSQIENWINENKIPYLIKDDKVFFDREKIEEWLTLQSKK